MLVIEPTFQAHGWPAQIDLDFFNVRCAGNNLGEIAKQVVG